MKMPLSSKLLAFPAQLAGLSAFCIISGYIYPSSAIGQETSQREAVVNLDAAASEAHSVSDLMASDPIAFELSEEAPPQSFQDVRYQELAEATESFLSSLDETQRAAVVLPFDHPFRTRAFCYVLARCNTEYVGLRMVDLNPTQKVALNNLLMKSFSGAGYSRAIQTMNREWLVEEMENAHRSDPEEYPVIGSPLAPDWAPPAQRAAPNYYIAFFGEPASMSPWGIRFEGHHLSLNLTFSGDGQAPEASVAPMFFGSSPMIVPASPAVAEGEANPYPRWRQEEGQQLLHREAWLARSFLASLEAQTIEPGTWSALPDVVLAGGVDVPLDANSYLDGERPGIAVAELDPLRQSLLFDYALEFLQTQANYNIDVDEFTANLANARVWWYGDIENEQGDLYFRVQSDRYLIELLQSNTFGVLSDINSNHVHSSFRDLTNDWDHDALGAHLQQFHGEETVANPQLPLHSRSDSSVAQ
jgi:hypothetical protein